ncbi:hypothetical protein M0805_003084 [Coniferiporia weirii]|nr:hypothetical protein M0805_003084 [Coniferiporia weirii]
MIGVLNYLKNAKNTLIGDPAAKFEFQRSWGPQGHLLTSVANYVNLNTEDQPAAHLSCSEETARLIRIEAANVITSLAHGPRAVLRGLLDAGAPGAILSALAGLSPSAPDSIRVPIVRSFRALCVTVADCTGPSLWGLGEECPDLKGEARSTLDCMFQPHALDVYLPLLESSNPTVRIYTAQILAFAVRVQKHRTAVTDWLPPEERTKENRGKRGWEVSALVDANSPSRLGGWVVRHLTVMLKDKGIATQEVALYAIAALVKDNPNIALVLSKSPPENKSIPVLLIASDFSKDRRSEVRLAACLCVTNILRSIAQNPNRRLSSTTVHVLGAIISNSNESAVNRMKACHILGSLVADDNDRCIEACKSGVLVKLAGLISAITPLVKPQEWEDGEAADVSHLREAALTAVGAISLFDNDIRNDITGILELLPLISVCLHHPNAGVRYGACLCVRALTRSVRVLRTNLLDSGVGLTLCEMVEREDEDRRVTNIALAGLCNLLNDFSPLRKTIMERGIIKRISELSRSQEKALRVGALWAIKNLLNKATVEEKQDVMNQLGWGHLRSCLLDPEEDIQEQALNVLANLASTSESHIDVVFDHLSGDELMHILADVLESSREEVILCQAVRVLGNISNGRDSHRMCLLSNARILSSLRTCLGHYRSEIRKVAISCVERLAPDNPHKLREAGIDDALQHIAREAFKPINLVSDSPETRRRTGGISAEEAQEMSVAARNALSLLSSADIADCPM